MSMSSGEGGSEKKEKGGRETYRATTAVRQRRRRWQQRLDDESVGERVIDRVGEGEDKVSLAVALAGGPMLLLYL